MTVIRKRKGRIARLAAAILAAAAVAPMLVVVGAGTAQAACTAFKFNGQTQFVFSDGSGITFLSFDERVAPTTGVVSGDDMIDGRVLSATGGIVNGRSVSITVNVGASEGSPGGSIIYRGEVSDGGNVSGIATITPNGGTSADEPFSSTGATLVCSDAPKQISVSWQEFIGGIKATVSMANNKGQVGCTYSTKGLETFDRRFTLFDDKPTDVTISPAVPLFQVWPVTITCDNGVTLETERFY